MIFPNTAPQAPALTALVLINDKDAAQKLNLSVHTLRKMRSQGTGPAYVKLGRACRYRLADLQAYVERSLVAR